MNPVIEHQIKTLQAQIDRLSEWLKNNSASPEWGKKAWHKQELEKQLEKLQPKENQHSKL